MKDYTIIGFDASTNERICRHAKAASAEEAEETALGAATPNFFVCAVLEGKHNTVDTNDLISNIDGDTL